ncbi:barstar family protein [Sphingobacterium sp. BIGb0165]|uniref:barstar family protein n=1 Tax=Sphingobacterium sp. BIGb0165 TaxID=2940615 RepID=UPI002168F35B|nr:barstar family protein [Sphingobacterium sp. BIGb0165]MCS4226069.1 RNAse (barnase) inhibitor barstar [Sphingobacterium sp. BIGb0165]
MKKIEFLENPMGYFNDIEYVAYLQKVKDKNDLFRQLSDILAFPDYFGDNWNALFDCLRDFSWISKRGVVLVQSEIPILSEEELMTYFEIIFSAAKDWTDTDDHYFKVIFSKEDEPKIMKFITDSK